MYKLLSILFFSLCNVSVKAQNSTEKIIYIIDSVAVMDDPAEDNQVYQEDIDKMQVVKNRDSLKMFMLDKWDVAIYIFTKAYRTRPDSLRKIRTTAQMTNKDGIWFWQNAPYNGNFIDYYYSGRKQGEGFFVNGKVNGLRVQYFQNGKPSTENHYTNGIPDGESKEYYEDGAIKQQGYFKDGKEEGEWRSYFPNGQVKQLSRYMAGAVSDSAFRYFSNGKVKDRVFIKNGKAYYPAFFEKINQLMSKSSESNKEGDTKSAIKYCTKVIEMDSNYADAYFSRGTIQLNEFQFDEAIRDLDRAILLEPFMTSAFGNRAFARIRKYQFGSSRTLMKNSEIAVLASKDVVPIPEADLRKVCGDLQQAMRLGERKDVIRKAATDYCPISN